MTESLLEAMFREVGVNPLNPAPLVKAYEQGVEMNVGEHNILKIKDLNMELLIPVLIVITNDRNEKNMDGVVQIDYVDDELILTCI